MEIMKWTVLMAVCVAGAQERLELVRLARIQAKPREELARVPNYTCLETISRFRDARSRVRTERMLGALDTVRLEIVYSDHREWYGSPGDRKLNSESPVQSIGGGMIGSGAFAGILGNVLAGAAYTYRGEEMVGGRRAVRYDFQLTREQKSLSISLPSGSGTVGQEGSVWADAETLDLTRIESRASEIPIFLPLIARLRMYPMHARGLARPTCSWPKRQIRSC
jgi:hypothetical protein